MENKHYIIDQKKKTIYTNMSKITKDEREILKLHIDMGYKIEQMENKPQRKTTPRMTKAQMIEYVEKNDKDNLQTLMDTLSNLKGTSRKSFFTIEKEFKAKYNIVL